MTTEELIKVLQKHLGKKVVTPGFDESGIEDIRVEEIDVFVVDGEMVDFLPKEKIRGRVPEKMILINFTYEP